MISGRDNHVTENKIPLENEAKKTEILPALRNRKNELYILSKSIKER